MLRILLAFCIVVNTLYAGASDTVFVNRSTESLNLGKYLYVLQTDAEAQDLQKTLARSADAARTDKSLFFSGWHHMDSSFWLFLNLAYTDNVPGLFLIELDNPLIGMIRFHLLEEGKQIASNIAGDSYPFDNRLISSRNYLYPLQLEPHKRYTVVFQLHNDGRNFHVPLVLKSGRELYTDNYSKQLIFGLFFGIMLIIVLVNIILYVLIREKIYFWFAAFIASFAMLQLHFSGYAFQYFWPDFPYLADKSGPVFTASSSILALQFTKYFYNRTFRSPYVLRIFRFWQCVLGACILGALFNGWFNYYAIYSLYYLFTVTYIIIFVVSLQKAFQKEHGYSRFYLGGVIIFILTAMFINLRYTSETSEENIFTNNTVLGGMVLIFSSISVSIFDRLLLLKKLKEKAQQEAIYHLEQLNLLKEQTNEILEHKVRQKTAEVIRKQQQVNTALIDGEETERKRFSKELHDGLGGLLSTIKLNLVSLNDREKSPVKELDTIIAMIDKACDEVRAISHNLTPPMFEKFGLVRSLQDVVNRLHESSHLDCHFEAYDYDSPFSYSTELSIYRMVLELINNTLKHADAGKLSVQLFTHDKEFTIMVEDDGKGLDPEIEPHGIGFRNIRSRLAPLKGFINIDSSRNKGTTIIIQIPLNEAADGKQYIS